VAVVVLVESVVSDIQTVLALAGSVDNFLLGLQQLTLEPTAVTMLVVVEVVLALAHMMPQYQTLVVWAVVGVVDIQAMRAVITLPFLEQRILVVVLVVETALAVLVSSLFVTQSNRNNNGTFR